MVVLANETIERAKEFKATQFKALPAVQETHRKKLQEKLVQIFKEDMALMEDLHQHPNGARASFCKSLAQILKDILVYQRNFFSANILIVDFNIYQDYKITDSLALFKQQIFQMQHGDPTYPATLYPTVGNGETVLLGTSRNTLWQPYAFCPATFTTAITSTVSRTLPAFFSAAKQRAVTHQRTTCLKSIS